MSSIKVIKNRYQMTRIEHASIDDNGNLTLCLHLVKPRIPQPQNIEVGAFKGSQALLESTNQIIQLERVRVIKKLPWWKRFWKRLFGVKTPDYTVGNYD